MNSSKLNRNVSFLCFLLVVLLTVPGVAGAGMDKKTSSAPTPPPQKQQAPPPKAPARVQPKTTTVQPRITHPGGSGPGGRPGPSGPRTNTGGVKPGPSDVPYAGRRGEQARDLPGGRKEFHNANGQTVTTNARGQVQRIEAPRGLAGNNKMVINRSPRGGRVVATGRPGARVVSFGPHQGFVERPLRPGYISRTYVRGGRPYARVYREYRYRNVAYYRYVPGVYYNRRFYAWAVTPWGMPVRYAWSGMAVQAPWFGFYSGYFTPYPVYGSPDMWLTDYVLADNLRLAYENEQAANAEQSAPPQTDAQATATPLSPEVKTLIAQEVKEQIAAEQAAAANTQPVNQGATPSNEQAPEALSPRQHIFVVASNLDVAAATGQQCSLTPGDVLMRKSNTPDANQNVTASVESGKQGDCTSGDDVAVSVQDLQDMHNHFREQIDSGLDQLANNQAKGLPNGPAAGAQRVAEGTADPAQDAESQLKTQDDDAVRLESQVNQTGT